MKIVDSNFNQHLLLFQHILLVKGNDDFPVSDYSDTDMNLEKQASSFQPLQDTLGFGAFCGVCFVLFLSQCIMNKYCPIFMAFLWL